MKKFLAFATLASVALVGCVNDEKMEMTSGAQKISFDTPVMSTQTRAKLGEIDGTTYPTDEDFKVYAIKHSESFTSTTWEANDDPYYMNGVTVDYVAAIDGWKFTGKEYYWPEDGSYLTFAAYSPADASGTATYNNNGLNLVDFLVPAATENQYDLMYSDIKSDCTSESMIGNSEYSGVPIVFNHALSSINFSIIKDESIANVATLHSIKIYGVKGQGDFVQNPLGTAAWTAKGGNITSGNAYVVTNTDNTFTTAKTEVNKNDVLLLPQDLTGDAKVAISYTLDGTKYDREFSLNTFKSGGTVIDKWEMGKRYNYVVSIAVNSIYFAPSIKTSWVDVDDIKVEL